jgi:hypothetical protein
MEYSIARQSQQANPGLERTIGVLTEPGRLTRTNRNPIMAAMDRKCFMGLRWHLLYNPTEFELNARSLESVESPFLRTRAAWISMDESKLGIARLRGRLQEMLAERMSHACRFESVYKTSTHNIIRLTNLLKYEQVGKPRCRVVQEQAAEPGPPVDTESGPSEYFTNVAIKFQKGVD